jgi:hypothetical protein
MHAHLGSSQVNGIKELAILLVMIDKTSEIIQDEVAALPCLVRASLLQAHIHSCRQPHSHTTAQCWRKPDLDEISLAHHLACGLAWTCPCTHPSQSNRAPLNDENVFDGAYVKALPRSLQELWRLGLHRGGQGEARRRTAPCTRQRTQKQGYTQAAYIVVIVVVVVVVIVCKNMCG